MEQQVLSDHQVQVVQEENLDLPDHQVHRDHVEKWARLDPWGLMGYKVQLVPLDLQVLVEREDLRVVLGHQGLLDTEGNQERWDHLVLQALVETEVLEVGLDLLVLLEELDPQVIEENQVLLDTWDLVVCPELLDLPVILDL